MNAKRNNNEVNAVNNQLAFDKFCKLTQEGYSIYVELKSKLRDKASFWITAIKEDEKTEEIRLFLNQEILDLVLNYLESGILGDVSKINPCDLESFNERNIEFKKELFQSEKKRGKNIVWSYTISSKLASIYYKQGVMIFHPYSYISNPANMSSQKGKKKASSISKESLIQIEINNLSFGSSYSLQVLSDYYDLVSNGEGEKLPAKNSFIDNKEIKKQKASLSLPKLEIAPQQPVLINIA